MMRTELRYEHPVGLWVAPVVDWSPATYFVDSANTERTDKYAVLDLKAGYDWANVSLFMQAGNLTDRVYSGSVNVDSAIGRFFQPPDGRSVYGGIRVHY